MEYARIASAARRLRHVFLRDLVLQASIGIHPHERVASQRVRINIDLAVEDDPADGLSRAAATRENLSQVVDYEVVATRIRSIVTAGHILLVETLAERIAESCLQDVRVEIARVRVEKLDVFIDTLSAGVEIERRQSDLSTR
jgi:dihydroneopterin aldolase